MEILSRIGTSFGEIYIGEKNSRLPVGSEDWQKLEQELSKLQGQAKHLVLHLGEPEGITSWYSYKDTLSLSPKNVKQRLRALQGVLQRIQTWPGRSIALLYGNTWDAGLEIALACQYRFGVQGDHTLGFPLLKSHSLPPVGGSLSRLARLVGFPKSFYFLWEKSFWSFEEAKNFGVLDELFPKGFLREEALSYLEKEPKREVSTLSWWRWHWLRIQCRRNFKRRFDANIWGGILEVLSRSPFLKEDHALNLELKIFLELVQNPKVRRIWRIAFEEIEHIYPLLKEDFPRHFLLVGGGSLGSKLAGHLLQKGGRVHLQEVNLHSLSGALKRVSQQSLLSPEHLFGRLTFSIHPRPCRYVEFALEAVLEDKEVKRNLLPKLEKQIQKEVPLITTTSSFSVEELAESLEHKERFLGLHFFPSAGKQVVEVIFTPLTTQKVREAAFRFVKMLGGIPIQAPDRPGFLLAKLSLNYFNEALILLEEGVVVEEIDGAMVNFGMAIGPLAHIDLIGFDTLYYLFQALEGYTPSSLVEIFYKNGRLGRESGKGIYLYTESPKGRVDPKIYDLLRSIRKKRKKLSEEVIRDRLLLPLARDVLEEVEKRKLRPVEVEMALTYALGFPLEKGGILHYGQERGWENVSKTMKRLKKQWGERFEPGEVLLEYSQKKGNFFWS